MENRSIQKLSHEALEELRAIYEEEFNETLPNAEVEAMGLRLLNLFKLLTENNESKGVLISDAEFDALVHIHDCLFHKNVQPTVRSIAQAINRSSSRSGQRMLENLIRRGLVWKDEMGRVCMKRFK